MFVIIQSIALGKRKEEKVFQFHLYIAEIQYIKSKTKTKQHNKPPPLLVWNMRGLNNNSKNPTLWGNMYMLRLWVKYDFSPKPLWFKEAMSEQYILMKLWINLINKKISQSQILVSKILYSLYGAHIWSLQFAKF